MCAHVLAQNGAAASAQQSVTFKPSPNSGEFEVHDVPQAAMCACTAMMRFFHPQMIAQCANKPGPSIDEMIDFVLAGLAPRKAAGTVG